MTWSKAEPGQTRIGWIGTGVMCRWMCQHLMTKGYTATVYNRTRDKAQPLIEAGAAWAATPKAVAERSDVVFAIGALMMAWDFIMKARPLLPIMVGRWIPGTGPAERPAGGAE